MYKHILIPLENSSSDETILGHIRKLAKIMGSKLTLIHVADGFAARYQEPLNLAPSKEMIEDDNYLKKVKKELEAEGFQVSYILDAGDPSSKIIDFANKNSCDLIAMSTHGHKFIKDLILGSPASKIRHNTGIAVLLIKSDRR